MNSSIISKSYNIIAILICLAITLLTIVIFVFPINSYLITPPYTEQKFILSQIVLILLTYLLFIPQPIALIGYYFADGIGKKWFANIVCGLLVLSLGLVFLMTIILVYLYITIVPGDIIGGTVLPLDVVKYLMAFLIFTNFFIFPVTFTIAALIVQKVSLWKRLLPLIALISHFIIAGILTGVIVAIARITRIETLYKGTQEATIPQFVMLGSVAWALVCLVAFFKNKKVDEVKINQPSVQPVNIK